MLRKDRLIQWAKITAESYIDEYPTSATLDMNWLEESFDEDSKDLGLKPSDWPIYRDTALEHFSKEKWG